MLMDGCPLVTCFVDAFGTIVTFMEGERLPCITLPSSVGHGLLTGVGKARHEMFYFGICSGSYYWQCNGF